jgi:hypothetical protein
MLRHGQRLSKDTFVPHPQYLGFVSPLAKRLQRSKLASLISRRWAISFWEMHLPSMLATFRRCCQAFMNALFALEAKRGEALLGVVH